MPGLAGRMSRGRLLEREGRVDCDLELARSDELGEFRQDGSGYLELPGHPDADPELLGLGSVRLGGGDRYEDASALDQCPSPIQRVATDRIDHGVNGFDTPTTETRRSYDSRKSMSPPPARAKCWCAFGQPVSTPWTG